MFGALVKEDETGKYGLLTNDHSASCNGWPVFVPLDSAYRPTGEDACLPVEVGTLTSGGGLFEVSPETGIAGAENFLWNPDFKNAVLRAGFRFDGHIKSRCD